MRLLLSADILRTMAADVCCEIPSLGTSPRISFSHDIINRDADSIEQCHNRSDASVSDSNSDFDFFIGKSFAQELPSADELFSNGQILPVEIKKQVPETEESPSFEPILSRDRSNITRVPCVHDNANESKKKRLKEFLNGDFDADETKPLSRSFWQFRRSTSLNCESRSRSLIRSLQFLSRSNSTGSVPNPKRTVVSKDYQKQHSFKQTPKAYSRSSSSSNNAYYLYSPTKKPPLMKSCRSYGNGVRVSPVLNIPHDCIGTASLFGFGSLLCNGKSKKKEK